MADITSHFAFPAFAQAGAEQTDRGAATPFVRPGQPAGAIGPASDFTTIFAQLLSGGSAARTQPSRVGEPDSQSPAAGGPASEIDIAALLDDLPPDLQQVIGDMLARNGGDWIVGFAQALAQHHQGVAAGGRPAPASFDTPAGGCATPVRPMAVIAGSKETLGMALPPAPSSHEDDVAPRPNPAAIPGLQDALPKPLVDNDAGTGPAPGISPRPAIGPGLAPKPQPDSDASPLTAGPGSEVAPRPAPHPLSMPTDHDTLPKGDAAGHAPGVTPRPAAPSETASSDTDTPTKPRNGDPVTDVSPRPAAAPVAASTDPVPQPKPREDDAAGLGAGASPRPGPAPQTGSSDTDTPAKPRNGDPIAGVSPRPAATPVAASAAPISEPKPRGDDAAGPAPAVTPRPAASSDTDTAPNPRSDDATAGASPWPGIGPAATPGPDSPAKPRASDAAAPAPGIAPRPNPMATTATAATTLDMAPKTPSDLGATPRPAPASLAGQAAPVSLPPAWGGQTPFQDQTVLVSAATRGAATGTWPFGDAALATAAAPTGSQPANMPPDGQSNLAAGPRTAPEQGTAAAAAFLAPTAQPVPRGPDAQQILPSGTLQPAGAADPGRPDIAAGPAPASRRADPAIRTRAASLPAQATPTPTTGNPLARVQTPNPGANGLATAWQPVAGQALPQSETGDPAELPLDGIESLAGTPIHTDRGAATAASPLRHAASPQHIAQQLAAAAPRPGEQPVELRLNPDELGHVRLTLLQGDGSISVTIQAERGETLELMRRHIAQLEAEFRDIGYSDIQFSFGASGQGGQETWADNGEARSSAAPADPETAPEIVATAAAMPPASGARDGLDLRL